MFAKRSAARRGRKRAQSGNRRRAEKVPQRLLGPKPFPLDRLMAIFYAIVEVKVDPSSAVYTQLASLVRLRLLLQVRAAVP